ncbi:MAG: hypothetical protein K0U52_11645 [Gammaproteobacteria bacterium]|nr:hypothetical protein [Gammaproteobacteria bacterium]
MNKLNDPVNKDDISRAVVEACMQRDEQELFLLLQSTPDAMVGDIWTEAMTLSVNSGHTDMIACLMELQ